ncbi:MAG: DUF45 domain-containing protein [Bacteroidales bacterium]|nr:DUF45 domain-containing protein [Bacteroidales bacterium]
MKVPENFKLIQKDVKHARLRVSEDGNVRVIIPDSFTQEDLDALLEKKKNWIKKTKHFLAVNIKLNFKGTSYFFSEIDIVIFMIPPIKEK